MENAYIIKTDVLELVDKVSDKNQLKKEIESLNTYACHKTGNWVKSLAKSTYNGDAMYYCSECKHEVISNVMNFCPSCGAKMI